MKYCDLHCHSTFSDGTCTPEEIVDLAVEARLEALAITDHNTIDGWERFFAHAKGRIEACGGCEFSTEVDGQELHLVGLFWGHPDMSEIVSALEEQRRRKTESNKLTIQKLATDGYDVSYEEFLHLYNENSANRVHIANYLKHKGIVTGINEAFKDLLSENGKYYQKAARLDFYEMISLIKKAGGVSVWAHPLLDVDRNSCAKILARAKACGLDGVEVYYSTYSDEDTAYMLSLSKELGVLLSGGSDFHGSNKEKIHIGTGNGNLAVPYECYRKLKEKSLEEPYEKNRTFFFIPFMYSGQNDFKPLIEAIRDNDNWELRNDEVKYMLKYVAEKFDSSSWERCQCFHFSISGLGRKKFGLGTKDAWYACDTKILKPDAESIDSIRFQLRNIDLFCFATGVCILTFRVHLEEDDPMWISEAQYYLKKVSREQFLVDGQNGDNRTMLQIAKQLMQEFEDSGITKLDFFYYSYEGKERSNVLTYLEAPASAEKKYCDEEYYKKILFYLKRCYKRSYLYQENPKRFEAESLRIQEDVMWGITAEASVCLTFPDMGNRGFIEDTFFNNFNSQYLFMYIILLHQKYALYMFLSKIGVGEHTTLEKLEAYRKQLYEFETDYVYSLVTEVPQYQKVYEKTIEAFELKNMYEDVHEPVQALREIRREKEANQLESRERKINNALILLSFLGVFSALVDGFDFAYEFFGRWFSEDELLSYQYGAISIVGFIVFIFLIMLVRKDSKRDE